jgi:biopolymer transport protein ExbB
MKGVNAMMRTVFAVMLGLLMAAPVPAQQQDVKTLDQLLQTVRERSKQVSAENQQRLRNFQSQRNQQAALLQDAKQSLAAQEARSERLKSQFDENERLLEELSETLRIRIGNFGELFGVVRQVAGDAKGTIEGSLVSAQYPERGDVADRLAQIKGLPSMDDLVALQTLMLEEMAESAKVVSFPTTIVTADGIEQQADVARVGVFNAVTGDRFLRFEPETKSLQDLPRQPKARFRSMAADLTSAAPGETVAMAVDPSRGSLLGLLIQAPSLRERVDQGGVVGYVIIGLGLIGLLIAVWRYLALTISGGKIRSQLKNATPNSGNALGRILGVYHDNKDIDTETLELKLDEAILKEAPKLEKWQGSIKVLAAVAPLMGLLGTVVGMIATFQAITLFGTGDPKLMAGGISQALVTTVLGLVVAIPLVLLHSMVAGKSKGLIEILEEQSAGLIAKHSEEETLA